MAVENMLFRDAIMSNKNKNKTSEDSAFALCLYQYPSE